MSSGTTIVLCTVLLLVATVSAVELSTSFVEVNLGCLKPGLTYSVLQERNLPVSVTNMGKSPVELRISVVPPRQEELREGYEPVLAAGWVKLEQERFQVQRGGTAITDARVSVPGDEQFRGRHFQVWPWSQTMSDTGIGAGLKSRLLFSVCEE